MSAAFLCFILNKRGIILVNNENTRYKFRLLRAFFEEENMKKVSVYGSPL